MQHFFSCSAWHNELTFFPFMSLSNCKAGETLPKHLNYSWLQVKNKNPQGHDSEPYMRYSVLNCIRNLVIYVFVQTVIKQK